jgi:methylmalonyl-CoA mutase cobalamin-binding subunit
MTASDAKTDGGAAALRGCIIQQLEDWKEQGRPSREQLITAADQVTAWRRERRIESLWPEPLLMLTATLDDGFGHGLEVIHRFAEAAGLRVVHLGKMLAADAVVDGCRRHQPRLLGLTVLQFDTEPDLIAIRRQIDPAIRIVAGGPALTADPELAERAGIDFVARNAADFWRYLLTL